ncbi:MAG: lysine--tRNA ligase [Planctomycetota bacterium]
MESDQREVRLAKLQQLRAAGVNPYPDRYPVTHTCAQASDLAVGEKGVRLAGRLMSRRIMGKLSFGHLQDGSGSLQLSLQRGRLPDAEEQLFKKLLDVGDHLGVEGVIWRTKTGEITLAVEQLTFLGKSLRPLPEKWHGLRDQELRYRQRYLDLVMSQTTRQTFHLRSRMITSIRRYLDEHGFLEVETPILQAAASGAAARPFSTRHHALDIDLYLRISPETYLKRLVAGGLDRVYEIGRNFRNEGLDASHLQEFTMLEYYAAYWNWRDNMRFVRELLQAVVEDVTGALTVRCGETMLDFGGAWPEISYRDLIARDTGIDLDAIRSPEELERVAKANGVTIEGPSTSLAALIDGLYKKISRPKLIQPIFLTAHPAVLVPLARRNDECPQVLDMFQVVANGWELVKAYSELVDPVEQYQRLEEQARLRAAGDDETMMMELDYIECMEHGMPPISGLGLGIDRLACLLAGERSLRDVVFFPTMRPGGESGAPAERPEFESGS